MKAIFDTDKMDKYGEIISVNDLLEMKKIKSIWKSKKKKNDKK